MAQVVKRKATSLCNLSERRKKVRPNSVTESDTQRETAAQELAVERKEADDFIRLSNKPYQSAENGTSEPLLQTEPIGEGASRWQRYLLSDTNTQCTKKRADTAKRGKKIKRISVAQSQKRIFGSGPSRRVKERIETAIQESEPVGEPEEDFSRLYQFAEIVTRENFVNKEPIVDSTTSYGDMPIPNMLNYVGINFYRRIGRWTAHIWAKNEAKSNDDHCQFYLGSYSTASEAARAYDKAQLKHFDQAARLNFKKVDYVEDIVEMARFSTNAMYRDHLKGIAKSSHCKTEEGVTRCLEGGFEVKIKEVKESYARGKPAAKWKFLGRFDNLADAERVYAMESAKLLNL